MIDNCVKCKSRASVPPSKYCIACGTDVWMDTCQKLIDKYEPLATFCNTWAGHCGAPKDVFIGQTCRMLTDIVGSKTLKSIDAAIEKTFEATSLELLQAMSPRVDEHLLLALRFLYYCKAYSALPDDRYDQAEREFLKRDDVEDSLLMNPGSDNADDYPEHVRALGFYIMLITEARRNTEAP